jgi:tRNA modification GTPase
VNLDDTIVSIATPPGRGGIGVVRIAGPEACTIAAPMLRLRHDLQAGRAVFGELIDPNPDPWRNGPRADESGRDEPRGHKPCGYGRLARPSEQSEREPAARDATATPEPGARIDEVVVTYFQKPHSYTTDDIVEIAAHGSPIVLRHIVECALARGARLAEPGEFTMRAFLNGRIDLTQAEAVRDLIESQTLYQARVAAQQLEGALSKRLQPIKKKLVDLIALLEAGIDFAEDDVSVLPDATILQQINAVHSPLQELAGSFAYGKIVHEGLTLAIVGRPNVGKSSLFNRLVERERAIVTATPGTTRDLVSETVALGGIPLKLVDTAGIRRALDEAESIGIRKSMEALAEADIVLVVVDLSQPLAAEDHELLSQVRQETAIVVGNKADLPGASPLRDAQFPIVRTSAITGEGIPQLRTEILRHLAGDRGTQPEAGFLTSLRHQNLVRDSLTALDSAAVAVGNKVPHEMLLLDLYNALRPLDEITGATTTDDILNLIFSTFCIGK